MTVRNSQIIETNTSATAHDPGSVHSIAAKVAVITLFFALWSFFYIEINEWALHSPRTRYLTSPRDTNPGVIQPWTAVIYVFGGFAAPLLPFLFNWRRERVGFVLLTYIVSSIILFVLLLAVPVGMRRPEYAGTDLGERLMRMVFAVDRETNCFPSSHAMFAVLCPILVAHGGAPRRVRTIAWLLAVSICVTTVTTGQHYYMDVVAGALTAISGYFVAMTINGLWRRRRAE